MNKEEKIIVVGSAKIGIGIIGLTIGDAMAVTIEFCKREELILSELALGD